MVIEQYSVYWVALDPTQGSEIQKTRPCVVISPSQMNNAVSTVIIAPVTSKVRNLPTRVEVVIARKKGFAVVDQIRTVDKTRISSRAIAKLTAEQILSIKSVINQMLVE